MQGLTITATTASENALFHEYLWQSLEHETRGPEGPEALT